MEKTLNAKPIYPLCVDLDDTLVKTDMLHESILLLIRRRPLALFLVLAWWLLKGKAYCKRQVAQRVDISKLALPWNEALIHWLHEEKKTGRKLVLITASDQRVAQAIADQLSLFDEVIGSDGQTNVRGRAKRAILLEKYGEKHFDYVGDASVDLPVWQASRNAYIVSNDKGLIKQAKSIAHVEKVFTRERFTFKTLLKSLRVHQYAKNGLIFLPWVLGHAYSDVHQLFYLLLAFVSFSLLASSVYVLNDLLDLPSDRVHHRKKKRPLASGRLSIKHGVLLGGVCFILAWVLATRLPVHFRWVLIFYYIVTVLYSFWLKRLLLVDVITLSCLYTVRVLAGMAVINAGYSKWVLLFSLFFFTSLAFLKRFAELHFARKENIQKLNGRNYHVAHIDVISMFGVCSGYLSVLIIALYLNSVKAVMLYQYPILLYAACPVFLYWISRMWLIAADGNMHDDPVVFAIKDKATYWVLMVLLAIGVAATFW